MAELAQGGSINMSEPTHSNCEVGMCGLRGEMRKNEPMSKHTSWRAGGSARNYYIPADLDDLVVLFQGLSAKESVYLVGLGSNLLVRDGGLDATVVAVHARLNDLQLIEQDQLGGMIYVGAGVACAKVARFAALNDLAGAEFLAGIPGTVGGALAMNAGCYGSETWELVERVKVINHSGVVSVRMPGDYKIAYRSVALKPVLADAANTEWFVGGFLKLKCGKQEVSRQQIKQLLSKRVISQPLSQPNAGSVFRNPPGDFAARLIESCGLKGFGIGGAMVSPKHANFIVNTGTASAADIEALIMVIQDTVKKKTGFELVLEVRIIGNARSNA
ncbi:MAG: UDP-N-acetylmuramate dehydrogenase [Nitrosomonas sp.]|nr:UDP-N-acetylmuramate dehydrogenase [Nitrosomonas sp.]